MKKNPFVTLNDSSRVTREGNLLRLRHRYDGKVISMCLFAGVCDNSLIRIDRVDRLACD